MGRLTISNIAYATGFDTTNRKINGTFANDTGVGYYSTNGAFTGLFSDGYIIASFVDGYADHVLIDARIVAPRGISADTMDAAEESADTYRDALRSARAVMRAYARPIVERKDVPDFTLARFTAVLKSVGPTKIHVIKAARTAYGVDELGIMRASLSDVVTMVNAALTEPQAALKGVTLAQAQAFKAAVEAEGAIVEIVPWIASNEIAEGGQQFPE